MKTLLAALLLTATAAHAQPIDLEIGRMVDVGSAGLVNVFVQATNNGMATMNVAIQCFALEGGAPTVTSIGHARGLRPGAKEWVQVPLFNTPASTETVECKVQYAR